MGVLNRSLTFEKMVGSGERNGVPPTHVLLVQKMFIQTNKYLLLIGNLGTKGVSSVLSWVAVMSYLREDFTKPLMANICDSCNEIMFEPKSYGPAPGMESLEERRLRAAREAEERERKLKEIEMMRNKKDDFGDTPQVYCMKITE